jgi:hypothetical protein
MLIKRDLVQTIKITENVCDVCEEKIVETKDLPADDPSFNLQGVVNGEKAWHFCCVEEIINKK